ncbi:MAG: hypothetical protein DSZ24_02980 [Thermodesulfatator sp.]|nr:MAG: hypothetical protein DSZ24_02980 [Thermodesulfatator sp.]
MHPPYFVCSEFDSEETPESSFARGLGKEKAFICGGHGAREEITLPGKGPQFVAGFSIFFEDRL